MPIKQPESRAREAAHWLFLRWGEKRDRKDWPAPHTAPPGVTDHPSE